MTSPELLPCPWCASRMALHIYTVENFERPDKPCVERAYVMCEDCAVEGPSADSGPESIAAWNARTQPTDESEVLAVADVLMTACEGPKGQLHPWRPFDFADVARKCIAALTRAPSTVGVEDIEHLRDYGENGYCNMTAGEAYKKGFAAGRASLSRCEPEPSSPPASLIAKGEDDPFNDTPRRAEELLPSFGAAPLPDGAVAWRWRASKVGDKEWKLCQYDPQLSADHEVQPLYAHPPPVSGDVRAALEPFADFADPREKIPADFNITSGSSMARKQLTMGDCYRARRALSPSGEK